MSPTCVLVIASLCVAPRYEPVFEVRSSGPVTRLNADGTVAGAVPDALFEQAGVKITLDEHAGRFAIPIAVLHRVCRNSTCVYYRKHCDQAAHTCSYLIGDFLLRSTGGVSMETYTVSFRTMDALHRAENNMYYVTDANTGIIGSYFSFSEFAQESASLGVTDCPYSYRPNLQSDVIVQGC